MDVIDLDEHLVILRKCYDKKPTLMIIKGESMVGKTTLSSLLRGVPKSFYFSLDQVTLDKNLPIKEINDVVEKLGLDFSSRTIINFCNMVFKNKTIFIDYCFKFISNKTSQLFIFDGLYFTNDEFLNEFIKKFENKYYIWVVNRPIKK